MAQRLDLPTFYVTNFWGTLSPTALCYFSPSGGWPWFEPYFFAKPDPTANFPYGFDVAPD